MKIAVIDTKICDKSPFCPVKRICPVGAVTQKTSFLKSEAPVIDPEKCIGCNKCVVVCPMKAVTMVKQKS
ncbi:MAG: 4Fe-4S ferredoxin [Alkaliphilus sp.]|jgi:Fe-S-cluster-containing hydrogenase component 2|nr:4Fe-4S dicluster domain-containing protein [bacterium AH-315-G05]MBN4074539.1 4Fe-4S dicluster domain-containing protein [bacterium AH-315-E09]PHS30223.1 MAG: 4Fe-4S ferredoxin [Alkaliphilus sp.]